MKNTTSPPPDLLTLPEVADYLRVSIWTVRRLVREGTLNPIVFGPRLRRIPRQTILATPPNAEVSEQRSGFAAPTGSP